MESNTVKNVIFARIAVLIGLIIGFFYTMYFNVKDVGIVQFIFLFMVMISAIIPYLLVEKAEGNKKFTRGILFFPLLLILSVASQYRLDPYTLSTMSIILPILYYFVFASAFIKGVFAKFTFWGLFWIPFALLIVWFGDLTALIKNLRVKLRTSKGTQLFKRVMTGLLVAIPFVIILFILLGSADPVFGKVVEDALSSIFGSISNSDIGTFITNIVLFIGSFLFFSTFLFSLWNQDSGLHKFYVEDRALKNNEISRKKTDNSEVKTVQHGKKWDFLSTSSFLGVLNVVFVLFVLIQFRYLFGGEQNISGDYGFTYSEYARRGFFELVAVSALVYLLCITLNAKVFLANTVQKLIFRGMYLIMVVATVFISISAIMRMSLYIEAYGYTTLRIFVLIATVLILLLVLSLAVILLLESQRKFVRRTVGLSFMIILISFFLVPVDFVVAKLNYNTFLQTNEFDYEYHSSLSDEVIPVLVEIVKDENVPNEIRYSIFQNIELRKNRVLENRNNWQSFNFFDQHNKYLLNSLILNEEEIQSKIQDNVIQLVNDYGKLLVEEEFRIAFGNYWKQDRGSFDYGIEDDYEVSKYDIKSVTIFVDREYRNPRYVSITGIKPERYRSSDYTLDLKLVSILKAEVKIDADISYEGYYSNKTYTTDKLTLEFVNNEWKVVDSSILNLRGFWIP